MAFFIRFVLTLFYLKTTANQNAVAALKILGDIPIPGVDEGYSSAERGMSYHLAEKYNNCSHPFAKYMVSIRYIENDDNFGHKHFCGGVIIRPALILTAAHCVIRKELHPSAIRVVAGTPVRLRKTPRTQVIKVEKVIIHELFLGMVNVDLALLKLREGITLDTNCTSVLPLPKQKINNSTNCMVLGWGKLYFNGPLSNEILQLDATLHSKEYCQPFFQFGNKSKICASVSKDAGKSPCLGDSGGPLVCEGVLTGILSYGFKCGYGYPTVYTDVYENQNWINKNDAYAPKCFIALYLLILVFWIN